MFLWRTPRGLKSFGTTRPSPTSRRRSPRTRGSTTGSWSRDSSGVSSPSDPIGFQVKVFFLACVIVAGLYGAATVSRRILVVQAVPAALALVAVLAAGSSGLTRSAGLSGPSQGTTRQSCGSSTADPRSPTDDRSRRHRRVRPIPFDLDDDDRLIGRVLTRREVLALMGVVSVGAVAVACAPGSAASGAASAGASGGAGATALATATAVAVASSLPSCVVVPELTEGPYYVNENLDRSDIRIDTSDGSTSEGAVLTLDWVVSQVDGNACIPLEGVLVDVWHCDAAGNYSDVGSEQGHDYLRGYQHTDASGKARIVTIYPGWYQGRAVHIHFKIRTDAAAVERLRVHVAALLRRRVQRAGLRSGVYAAKGKPDSPERQRRDLPAEPGHDPARRRQGRRRLQGHLRDRDPDDVAASSARPGRRRSMRR